MATSERSAFASAAHVLRHDTMTWATEEAIDDAQQRIDVDLLLERRPMLSGGEKVMLDVAIAIWNGGVDDKPALGDMLRNLSGTAWDRVLNAITAYKPTVG